MLQYVFDSIALVLLNRIWFDRGICLVQEAQIINLSLIAITNII